MKKNVPGLVGVETCPWHASCVCPSSSHRCLSGAFISRVAAHANGGLSGRKRERELISAIKLMAARKHDVFICLVSDLLSV